MSLNIFLKCNLPYCIFIEMFQSLFLSVQLTIINNLALIHIIAWSPPPPPPLISFPKIHQAFRQVKLAFLTLGTVTFLSAISDVNAIACTYIISYFVPVLQWNELLTITEENPACGISSAWWDSFQSHWILSGKMFLWYCGSESVMFYLQTNTSWSDHMTTTNRWVSAWKT